MYEADCISYLEYGVHVMSIHHGSHVEFLGQVADQSVDEDGGIWIQTLVRLVAEQV